MTGEAVVRQDRTNLAVEINRYSTWSMSDLRYSTGSVSDLSLIIALSP